MFLEICIQIHFEVFALSRQVNKQKVKMYAKTINLLCAGNKIFVTYQTQGGVNPQTPTLHTPLLVRKVKGENAQIFFPELTYCIQL